MAFLMGGATEGEGATEREDDASEGGIMEEGA